MHQATIEGVHFLSSLRDLGWFVDTLPSAKALGYFHARQCGEMVWLCNALGRYWIKREGAVFSAAKVPTGRPTIAQRFIAGINGHQIRPSPVGRKITCVKPAHSFVPGGTCSWPTRNPSVETLGYGLSPVWAAKPRPLYRLAEDKYGPGQ